MADSTTQPKATVSRAKINNPIDPKAILQFVITKWYWIVISLALTLSIAALHLMKTVPQHTRTISLLIKNKDASSATKNASVDLSQLGILEDNTNLENELRVITSPTLVQEVVARLNLNDKYYIKDGLRSEELYKSAPVIFADLDTVAIPQISFTFKVRDDKQIEIDDIKENGVSVGDDFTTSYGDTIKIGSRKFAVIKPTKSAGNHLNQTITYHHGPVQWGTADLAWRLHASIPNPKSSIIDISITYPNITEADDILNTLVQVYNERWILEKNQIAVSTSRFIDERLGVIEKDLGNVDSDISSYKSANLLPDVSAATQMYMSQSSAAQATTIELDNQIAVAEMIRKQLSRGTFEEPLPTNMGIVNADIETAIGQYNATVIERNRLLETTGDFNPVVKDRTQTLRTLKGNILASLDSYIATLRTQMSNARRQLSMTTSKIASNPTQAKYLLSVERQQKVKESLYLFLLQKREENELSQAFTAYNTSVVENPHPGGAATPNRSKVWTIAIMLGLGLPIGFFIIREMLDTKVRGKKDLESLKIPYLGEIPTAEEKARGLDRFKKKQKTEERKIVVKQDNRNLINEAFRVVRTNIEFLGAEELNDKTKIIAVTSTNPGSGKTFISINLAKAIALKGLNVLVIDLDIRKGSLSKLIGKPEIGITDYIIGKAHACEIIRGDIDGTPTLSAIGVGSIPPNPAELLSSKRLDALINELKDDYDYIILDCPPAEIVTDARVINRLADSTIFIVRSGLLDKEELLAIQEYFDSGRYKNMAILLNGTDFKAGYAYNRYGYSYGYGYGYGLGKTYGSTE